MAFHGHITNDKASKHYYKQIKIRTKLRPNFPYKIEKFRGKLYQVKASKVL